MEMFEYALGSYNQWYHLIIQDEESFIRSHHYIKNDNLNSLLEDLPLKQIKELKKFKKIYFNGNHYILTKLPHEFVFKS